MCGYECLEISRGVGTDGTDDFQHSEVSGRVEPLTRERGNLGVLKNLCFDPAIALNMLQTNCETQPLLLRVFDLRLEGHIPRAELVLKISMSIPV